MNFFWSVATEKNSLGVGKPNEDFYFADEKNSFFLLLDGVSRPKEEYPVSSEESVICRLNELFCQETHRALLASEEKDPSLRLKEALQGGNRALSRLGKGKTREEWHFLPAAVGIAAQVVKDRFHFAYVGDCLGVLLREDAAVYFGEQKSVRYAELQIPPRPQRYACLCNRPENPLSHGAFNGEESLDKMIRCGSFSLENRDVILLSTDGAGRLLQWASPEHLRALTPQEVISESKALDQAPFAKYADDKTVLRLEFTL